MRSLQVDVMDRLEDARGIREEWAALSERALDREPFLTPEWLLSWWEAFGTGEMMLVTVRKGPKLIGVAPFRVETESIGGQARRVLRLWSNAHSNRAHLVLDSTNADAATEAIVRAIYSDELEWDVARLGPVWQDGSTTPVLLSALSDAGNTWGIYDGYSSPYLKLPPSWDELTEGLSRTHLASLRRKRRKALREAELEFGVECEAEPALDLALAIDQRAWQHDAGTGLSSTKRVERFYRSLSAECGARGWLAVPYLTMGGIPVSYELNLRYHGVLYNLKLGYRKEWATFSPGVILKEHVLRGAIADGLAEYDLLGTAEPYKLKWTDTVRRTGVIWLHRRGLIPRLLHFARFGVREALRRGARYLEGPTSSPLGSSTRRHQGSKGLGAPPKCTSQAASKAGCIEPPF